MKSNSLFIRSLSGIVLVLVMVGMTLAWYDPATGVPGTTFYVLWTIVGLLTVWEYARLVKRHLADRTAGARVAWYVIGLLYIAQAIVLVMLLDPMMVVTLLTVVWLSDTGAYLVGSAIGRHKMAPTISPKKTWEGFAGGMLFAVGTALVWFSLYWSAQFDGAILTWGEAAYDDHVIGSLKWAGFGVVVGLAATLGDLIESKFKRTIRIKDSGGIIPGHGGMLDRFDALLLAVPVAWGYILLTGLLG
ncbi:phosphatidate cytidylyltransferase [Millionella massiliensis]|uniref:phosphatidate cytidylyltransferase n=1 Tax=Millionella massiliensis TaxID=1871023 RepID=UPI0024B83D5B|nr:phosphatidate cytidylyltransferase [Millionella massiliensis]